MKRRFTEISGLANSSQDMGVLPPSSQFVPSLSMPHSPVVIRSMSRIAGKPSGISSQGFIGKSPIKKRDYVVKIGPKITSVPLAPGRVRNNAFSKETSDVLFEFIFAPLNKMLLNDMVPDIRLYIDEDNRLCLRSRMMDFDTLSARQYANPKKPANFEQLIAVSAFLGNDDFHHENISYDGKMVDGGRSSALLAANAEVFISIVECLFNARFNSYGYKLNYQKLRNAFELIQSANKDEMVEAIRGQIKILKEQMPNKDLREIKFLTIPVSQVVEQLTDYNYCIRKTTVNSWDELEEKLVEFVFRQFAMLGDVIEVLSNKIALEQVHVALSETSNESENIDATLVVSTLATSLTSHLASSSSNTTLLAYTAGGTAIVPNTINSFSSGEGAQVVTMLEQIQENVMSALGASDVASRRSLIKA